MRNRTAGKKLFIGITGGIGSGKSLVCGFFEKLGCKIFYADEIARSLYLTCKPLRNALIKEFGMGILDDRSNGIDLDKFRKLVFSSGRNQKRVNSIVHPFVIEELIKRSKKLRTKIILVEAALIFESGFEKYLDYTVEVFSPVIMRIKRVKKRSPKLTLKDIRLIIKLQMPEKEKVDRADFIIQNNKDIKSLRKEVFLLHRAFLQLLPA
jgi:dephospho-CoA kinase